MSLIYLVLKYICTILVTKYNYSYIKITLQLCPSEAVRICSLFGFSPQQDSISFKLMNLPPFFGIFTIKSVRSCGCVWKLVNRSVVTDTPTATSTN